MFKSGIWAVASGGASSFYRSIESYDVNEDIVNPNTKEVVGDVETEITEMAVESLAISNEVDEIQRTAAVAETGEVIADIATAVARRDATPEEAALVQAGAAQTAVAAGANPSDVADVANQVASESYGKYTVSAEGFVETIKNLWQKLKDWVMGVIQKIKNAWNRFWNSTESLKKKAKKLLDLLKDKKDKKKEDNLEKWSGYFKNITVSEKFDPIESLKMLERDGKAIGDEMTKGIKDGLDKILKGVEEINKDVKKDAIDEFVSQLLNNITNSGNENLSSYLGNDYKGSKLVLPFGNMVLVTGYNSNQNISESARLNSFTMRLVPNLKTFDPKPKDLKVPYYSKDQIEKLANGVEAVAKSLDDWYNKGTVDAYKKVDEICKKIDDKIKDVSETADAETKDRMRIIQRFFVLPTQSLRASMESCTYMIRTCNDMLSYGFLNAKNLEDKDDK